MAIFKCKMCGGTLEISSETVAVCEYCGTKQTLPRFNNDRKANLYDRANHFRRNNEFDKAMGIYEQILNEDTADAEAYWSLVLCRYGIEYVEDPASKKRIPTVNRAQFTSIFDDEDYKSALCYADTLQKSVYEAEANAINEIQKGILKISQKEKPFDIFICYKETDAGGRRTPDSVLATELYHELCKEGFKVFFSRITLEDKLGTAYEPYIFAALNSAKVMVVLGTKQEYFNAVWVKNEWGRYLALIKNGAEKILIPAYRDMDPYDLPEEFSHLQAQDMSKLGFMQDLVRGISKIVTVKKSEPVTVQQTVVTANATNVAPLLKRAFIFLEDGDWASANEYCEKVLDLEPENGEAYLGKLMAELQVKIRNNLANCANPFDENNYYIKAIRFGDDKLKAELAGYINHINERNEFNRLAGIYNQALTAMSGATNEFEFKRAAEIFKSIKEFKNSAELAEECTEKSKIAYNDSVYATACEVFNDSHSWAAKETTKTYEESIQLFKSLNGWKDSEEKILLCQKRIEEIKAKAEADRIEREQLKRIAAEKKKKKLKLAKISAAALVVIIAVVILTITVIIPAYKYNKALDLVEIGIYDEAISIFTELGDYKDSIDKIPEAKYLKAAQLAERGDYNKAIAVFTELGDYKDAKAKIYNIANKFAENGDYRKAAICYGNAGSYSDAKEKSFELWDEIAVRETVSAGYGHTVGLKSDGTVVAVGYNYHGRCDVSDWTDIVAVSAGWDHTVGLKADSTVVAVGDNDDGQCDVSGWTDIVAVSAGFGHTVGLKSDGTVVAVGYNGSGQCDVSGWTDIVAVSAGYFHTIGLKSDGTVVAVGSNGDGQCDVNVWEDIVAVSAGGYHTVGLKSDGTVVATEYIDNTDYSFDDYNGQCDVSGWTDIVAVSAGDYHTVALKSDGTVVAVGNNVNGRCDVSNWTDIVAFSAGGFHTVGLKSDGTVVAVGDNDDGQCNVSGWKNIKQP